MNLGSESETVEFKKPTGEHKEALQAMSAMLNKHGRGELYFGVKDNGEVIGQDATDATIRQIAGWISDKVEPPISPTIDRLTDEDAKAYIRVAFSGMDAPYSADGRYFTRVGTSNKQMAASELATMIIERDRARNPWDSLPSGRPIEDVDEAAVREFVEMGKAASRIGDGPADAAGVLKRLGMLAPDGTLTNAGAVMFCHSPIQYPRMKLGLLAGNDKLDIFDLQQEGLPLIQLLKKAEFFVVSNIRRRFVFGEPGMQRREIPEIPREAVREAIANALCHRDYTTGTAVEVNVYMDFVEVVSPGLFPEGDAPENHLAGGDGGLKQRNPGIAQALFRSGMIEQYGTGIPPHQAVLRRRGREVQLQADRQHHRHPIRPPGRASLHRGKRFNAETYRRCKIRDSRRSRENRHNVGNRKRTRDKTRALRSSRDWENEGRSNP